MKRITLIAIIFTLAGCSFELDIKPTIQDERLLPYAERVQDELGKRGVYIDLDFNLKVEVGLRYSEEAYGQSRTRPLYQEIVIDDSVYYRWKADNREYAIESLILHEIGHNRLGLKHADRAIYSEVVEATKGMLVMRTGVRAYDEKSMRRAYDAIVYYYENY